MIHLGIESHVHREKLSVGLIKLLPPYSANKIEDLFTTLYQSSVFFVLFF